MSKLVANNLTENLVANDFVKKVQQEEQMAPIRAAAIKKKYQEKRDEKFACQLTNIFNSTFDDQELAQKLQQFYYTNE